MNSSEKAYANTQVWYMRDHFMFCSKMYTNSDLVCSMFVNWKTKQTNKKKTNPIICSSDSWKERKKKTVRVNSQFTLQS